MANTLTLNRPDGFEIKAHSWPKIESPKAIVLIVHGYAEYAKRYDHVAQFFQENNYQIAGIDLRGHGESSGERAYVPDFTKHIEDVKAFKDAMTEKYPNLPIIMLGHSMGGLIASYFSIKYPKDLDYLLLSGPYLGVSREVPKLLIKLGAVIAAIAPKLKVVDVDASMISKDPKVVEDYLNDPMIYTGKTPAATGNEMVKAMKYVQANASKIKTPIYILHGKADRLAEPSGTEQFFANLGSADKEMQFLDGLLHEILNEPEQAMVMEKMLSWLTKRLA